MKCFLKKWVPNSGTRNRKGLRNLKEKGNKNVGMNHVEPIMGDTNNTPEDTRIKGLGPTVENSIFLIGMLVHDSSPSKKVEDVDFLLEVTNNHNMDKIPLDVHASPQIVKSNNVPNEDSCF